MAWKELGGNEKAKWEEKAKEDKVRYQKEMSAYSPPSDDGPGEAKAAAAKEVYKKDIAKNKKTMSDAVKKPKANAKSKKKKPDPTPDSSEESDASGSDSEDSDDSNSDSD